MAIDFNHLAHKPSDSKVIRIEKTHYCSQTDQRLSKRGSYLMGQLKTLHPESLNKRKEMKSGNLVDYIS